MVLLPIAALRDRDAVRSTTATGIALFALQPTANDTPADGTCCYSIASAGLGLVEGEPYGILVLGKSLPCSFLAPLPYFVTSRAKDNQAIMAWLPFPTTASYYIPTPGFRRR